MDSRGTLTDAEHQALAFLDAGPALLGPHTGTVTARPLPRLYDTANDIVAGARLADVVNQPRPTVEVRTVDVKVARRLAKAGLVTIDPGGTAHRTTLPPEVDQ